MLTPQSRLSQALASNPKAPTVLVYAGDVWDACDGLDPKNPSVAALQEVAADAERPGVEVRVPAKDLAKALELAALRRAERSTSTEPKKSDDKKPGA